MVSPAQPGLPEVPALSGGFTVRSYGSSHADGLDAMQLELTRPLRSDPALRTPLIEVLAYAIGNLASRYAGFAHAVPECTDLTNIASGPIFSPTSESLRECML